MAEPSMASWLRANIANPVLRALLCSPAHPLLSGSLLLLDYISRRSEQRCLFPVQYAIAGGDIIVVAGQHRTKTWWRHFDTQPQHVTVHFRGRAISMMAQLLATGTDDHERAIRAYLTRFPKATVRPDVPVLVLRAAAAGSNAPPR